jgi:hypothetical protein
VCFPQIIFYAYIKMAGGLMQLVAYGAQDVYLTGSPSVTFFQAVYKRHTNFAMETIQQTNNGSVANNQRISVTIARNGDLVGNMYVELQPTTGLSLTANNTGGDTIWCAERAFAAIELTIGGQRIDKHYQTWFRLYSELFQSDENRIQYNKMTTYASSATADSTTKVYLPLIFFFNRNPGLYLPLIALQYHEVRLDIDCANNYETYFSKNPPIIWANYVFLDTEERRRFAQKAHEYLIEQVQHTGGDSLAVSSSAQSVTPIRLSFNHPVKELIWCYQTATYAAASSLNAMWNFTTEPANCIMTVDSTVLASANCINQPNFVGAPVFLHAPVGYTGPNGSVPVGWSEEGAYVTVSLAAPAIEVGPLSNWKLILNGQDRLKEQQGKYFNQVQPFYHHTGNPYPGIYCYSFALHPEEHQPTGTCNFSRIDNAQVSVLLKPHRAVTSTVQKLFAINYNILRIQSGMGGLAFSN